MTGENGMKRCDKCGCEIWDSFRNCPYCGKIIKKRKIKYRENNMNVVWYIIRVLFAYISFSLLIISCFLSLFSTNDRDVGFFSLLLNGAFINDFAAGFNGFEPGKSVELAVLIIVGVLSVALIVFSVVWVTSRLASLTIDFEENKGRNTDLKDLVAMELWLILILFLFSATLSCASVDSYKFAMESDQSVILNASWPAVKILNGPYEGYYFAGTLYNVEEFKNQFHTNFGFYLMMVSCAINFVNLIVTCILRLKRLFRDDVEEKVS